MLRSLGLVAFVFALAAFGTACSNSSPTVPTTVTTATVTSIAVTGTVPALGAASQFQATATMSDGSTLDVTPVASWQTSNAADATVSSSGVVTGLAAGTANITATYQNVTGTDAITIAGS